MPAKAAADVGTVRSLWVIQRIQKDLLKTRLISRYYYADLWTARCNFDLTALQPFLFHNAQRVIFESHQALVCQHSGYQLVPEIILCLEVALLSREKVKNPRCFGREMAGL